MAWWQYGIGPHVGIELRRLTRRGSGHWLRMLFAGGMLATLFFNYAGTFGIWEPFAFSLQRTAPVSVHSRFAERTFQHLFLLQVLGIFLLVPFYFIDAIVGERRRQTLDLLLITHLSPFEIVASKLVAGCCHIAGILAAGLPVVALLQLWGGINLDQVVGCYLFLAGQLVGLGSLTLMCSVRSHDFWEALWYTTIAGSIWLLHYSLAIGMPFRFTYGGLVDSVLFHFLLAFCCLRASTGKLLQPPPEQLLAPPIPTTDLFIPPTVRQRLGQTHPLVWKDTQRVTHFQGWQCFEDALNEWLFVLVVLFSCLIPALHFTSGDERAIAGGLITYATGSLFAAGILLAGLRATLCVVQEREQHTLDSLYLLPWDRSELLEWKWFSAIYPYRWVLAVIAGMVSANAIFGGLAPSTALNLLASMVVDGALLVTLGLWVSVRAPTVGYALFWWAAGILLAWVGPLLVGRWLTPFLLPLVGVEWSNAWERFWTMAVPAPLAWWHAIGYGSLQGLEIALGRVLNLALAALLWYDACRRFGRAED